MDSVFEVGDIVEGVITKIVSYGAFIILPDNSQGLIHISEIADSYIRNINRYLHIGSPYLVKIIEKGESGFIKASIRQISEQEKEENRSKTNTKIYNLTDFNNLKESINKGEK